MTNIGRAKAALIKRILEGDGTASRDARRAAFDGATPAGAVGSLLEKVARRASAVTDADIAAARSAGLTEDQIFELVVCAAIGEADRQHTAAMAALEAASAER